MKSFTKISSLLLLLAGNTTAIEEFQNVVKVDLTRRPGLHHHVEMDAEEATQLLQMKH